VPVEKLPKESFVFFDPSEMVQVAFKAAPLPLFYEAALSNCLN